MSGEPVKGSYCGGEGGYGWIEESRRDGWRVVPSWGEDGWDLGAWPLVSVSFRERGGKFEVVTYCEGDLEFRTFATETERSAFVDEIAEFYWHNETSIGPHELKFYRNFYPTGPLPERFRGPFSWARLDAARGPAVPA